MTAPVGVWLGASKALGRPAPAGDPYPHICRLPVFDTVSGRPVRLTSRDCPACHNHTREEG